MKRESLAEEAKRTMSVGGKAIRLKLKAIYGGPEAAEAAIRERAVDIEYLENWADRCMDPGVRLRFADLPAPMRDDAVISVAAAMLAWEREQAHA